MNMPATNETSQAKPNALPESWVSALFDNLAAVYGNRFTDMWRGVDTEKVRQVWGERLVVYPPQVLKYALEQCKDTLPSPPSLPQFVALCRQGMHRFDTSPKLPAPTMDRETARVRLQQCLEKSGFKSVIKGSA